MPPTNDLGIHSLLIQPEPRRATKAVKNAVEIIGAIVLVLAALFVILPRFFNISIEPVFTISFAAYSGVVLICTEVVYLTRQESAIILNQRDSAYEKVAAEHDARMQDALKMPRSAFIDYCALWDAARLEARRMSCLRRHGVIITPREYDVIRNNTEELRKRPLAFRYAIWRANRVRIRPVNPEKYLIGCSALGAARFTRAGAPRSQEAARRCRTLRRLLPTVIGAGLSCTMSYDLTRFFSIGALMAGIANAFFLVWHAYRGEKDGREIVLVDGIAYLNWRTNLYNGFLSWCGATSSVPFNQSEQAGAETV